MKKLWGVLALSLVSSSALAQNIAAQDTLAAQVACPSVIGVALVDPNDKTTWRIDYAVDTTSACEQAAQAALSSFSVANATAAQAAQAQYAAAVAVGLTIAWSTSTALNGTYPLGTDPITNAPIQVEILAELAAIGQNGTFTNGQVTRGWPTVAGTYPTFTVAQFKALPTSIAAYVDELAAALGAAASEQTASWPSASVTINQ